MPVDRRICLPNSSEGFHLREDGKDENNATHQKQEPRGCTHCIVYGFRVTKKDSTHKVMVRIKLQAGKGGNPARSVAFCISSGREVPPNS